MSSGEKGVLNVVCNAPIGMCVRLAEGRRGCIEERETEGNTIRSSVWGDTQFT